MKPPASDLIEQMRQAIELDLQRSVQSLPDGSPDSLLTMVSHHFGWSDDPQGSGGKRIRPILTLLVCAACGADWRLAIPAATCSECIHNFSLLHDDIQDGSETRRGRPTVWKLWGEAQAINAGDALFALARLVGFRLAELGVDAAIVLQVQREFDLACLELTRGQHLDLAFETATSVSPEDYLEMVGAKTGSLLAACASTGARVAGAAEEVVKLYREFAYQLGIAFQIHDDILGIWGDPALTGKPAGDDLRIRKKTFPVLWGLQNSAGFRRLWADPPADERSVTSMIVSLEADGGQAASAAAAQRHTDRALALLAQANPQGSAGLALGSLSQALLQRQG